MGGICSHLRFTSSFVSFTSSVALILRPSFLFPFSYTPSFRYESRFHLPSASPSLPPTPPTTFPSLRTFHLNDLSSSPSLFPHSRSGRLELLRVLLEEGIRKGGVLARLEDLSLRNTGKEDRRGERE
jgi:hypothetical protein